MFCSSYLAAFLPSRKQRRRNCMIRRSETVSVYIVCGLKPARSPRLIAVEIWTLVAANFARNLARPPQGV